MTDATVSQTPSAKTVQGWIDERPIWPDGTSLPSVPMTSMQWLIWGLAAAGKFFEGFVVFMTGVALPLLSAEFHIGAAEHGIISAASLFGILIGAVALGGLSDRFGRKPMFIIEMVIFVVFLAALCVAPNYYLLVIFLFGLGLSLGCDYPTAHMIISESIPSLMRGKLVLGAFAFQAVGALAGTAVGYGVLATLPELSAWRWMYASALIPAILVLIGRFYIVESANWLFARGEAQRAEAAVKRLLVRTPQYPTDIKLITRDGASVSGHGGGTSYAALFNKTNLRATILASVPWFLQDLGTYGIGIFTPTILAAAVGANADHARSVADIIANDITAAKGAALITTLLIVGIIFAVLLADVVGRIRLQVLGFVGCAAGLLLASFSSMVSGGASTLLIFAGFMLFNFMTNLGPNAQTYLLAGEVFPTAIRGKGAGFAAAFAKVGAVLTAFLFPILLTSIGTTALLYGLIVTSILGAIVTWLFKIETTGINLDELEQQ
ncbi:MFS transporter [Lichenihabitans sp. PAMC28606]|uniref:MFS transporter n=1 Tax=Lichenihabitans sp. PAMC28606 TaxID=2880932 RepID=UPI001D09A72E|nr:MFS transporter [Lichenihabitans sp. PAMC28606]UDL96359.1 MFS transporter [Lichenihabitans sp. PAMC28606]